MVDLKAGLKKKSSSPLGGDGSKLLMVYHALDTPRYMLEQIAKMCCCDVKMERFFEYLCSGGVV